LPAGVDLVARPQKEAKPGLAAIRKSLVALARRVAKRAAAGREQSAESRERTGEGK
jgi:hypothetical protein